MGGEATAQIQGGDWLAVGRLHSHRATTAQQAPGTQHRFAGKAHQATAELTAIVAVATCLARRGTARWERHCRTMGPNRGCISIHRSYFSLPREKQKAANKMKGVVGKIGKTTPTKPVASAKTPQASQAQRCQRGRLGLN